MFPMDLCFDRLPDDRKEDNGLSSADKLPSGSTSSIVGNDDENDDNDNTCR